MNVFLLLSFFINALLSAFIGLGGGTFYLLFLDLFSVDYAIIPYTPLILICMCSALVSMHLNKKTNHKNSIKSIVFFIAIACLTISDTRDKKTDVSGNLLARRIQESGHSISDSKIVKDNVYAIRATVSQWIADETTQVVIATGGTGIFATDVTPEALEILFNKHIDGFGELFRYLSYKEIGTSTMQSRVCAGIANNTIIFALPGSSKACETGWKLIKEQLDSRKKSCSFINVLCHDALFGN